MTASDSLIKQRPIRWIIICIVVILLSSFLAAQYQSNFGDTSVEIIKLEDADGNRIIGKLYTPNSATPSNPSGAALLLHGLNNDKDTQAPLAIELSKRGITVLALDEFNHGSSDAVGDPLSGESSDLGAITAFDYLGNLSYVDSWRIGLVGHSMGGYSANVTALARPFHRAIIFQAFGPLNLTENSHFNNYLQIWPKYEESANVSRQEWIDLGTEMITYNVESAGQVLNDPVYDTTYGSVFTGTAHRYALTEGTHPSGTWNSKSITESVAWLIQALDDQPESLAFDDAEGQTYYLKETLTLIALLFTILLIIPLSSLFLSMEWFKPITQPLSEKIFNEGRSWWRIATLNALIGGITFVIFPFIGVVLFGSINEYIPIFGLFIGNAFLFWFLLNALIGWIIMRRWWKRNDSLSLDDIGGVSLSSPQRNSIILKSAILAFLIMAIIYIIAGLVQLLFVVELRFMWAFFRVLTFPRFVTMLLYIVPISWFFIVNGGSFLFGQARYQSSASDLKSTLKWSLANIYNMLSIIILVFLIEYVPMIVFGTKPLLGGFLGVFWLLGIFLMQIIPEFIVLLTIMTVLYNKTGRYYLGSFLASIFVTMVLVNGAFN